MIKKILTVLLINIVLFSFWVKMVYAFDFFDWLKSIFGLEATTTYYCYTDSDCCSGNYGQYADCRGMQQSSGSVIYQCVYRSTYADGYTYCSGSQATTTTTKPPTTTTKPPTTKLCVKDGIEYPINFMYCDGSIRVICIKDTSYCPSGTTCSGGWSYYPCPSGMVCQKDTITGALACVNQITTKPPTTTTKPPTTKNCDALYGDKRLVANNGEAVCTQVNTNILQCYVCKDGNFVSDFNQLRCNGAQICNGEIIQSELYKAYSNCQLAFDKACKITTSTTIYSCGINNPCPQGMKCYLGSCVKFDTENCAHSDCRCTSDNDCANGYVCYPNKCENGVSSGELMCVRKEFKDICEQQKKELLNNPFSFITESIKLEFTKIFGKYQKYISWIIIVLLIFFILWILT